MNDQYVIGEGVVLDARPVSFVSRGLAFLLDLIIYSLALTAIFALLLSDSLLPSGYEAQIAIIIVVFIVIVLPMTVETLSRGRSLGKLAAGIQVVRDDGGPIGLRQAFIRSVVGSGELWLTLGAIAVTAAMFNDRGKRVGDMLAGTYAIRVRSKKVVSEPLVIPAPLVPWVKNADIAKLPDGLALAARQFLNRRWSMTPAARATMAERFYSDLAPRVAPAPPFSVAYEDFIVAVIAERSERESEIETRRVQRAAAIQTQMSARPFGIG